MTIDNQFNIYTKPQEFIKLSQTEDLQNDTTVASKSVVKDSKPDTFESSKAVNNKKKNIIIASLASLAVLAGSVLLIRKKSPKIFEELLGKIKNKFKKGSIDIPEDINVPGSKPSVKTPVSQRSGNAAEDIIANSEAGRKTNAVSAPSEAEIKTIKTAKKGIIRSAGELSAQDLTKMIDHDLMVTRPEDVSKILDSFAPEERHMAAAVMKKMTQFGNFKSLNDLVDVLEKETKTGIIRISRPSLADNLGYLQYKNNFEGFNMAHFDGGDTLVLDHEVLFQLKNNPKFLSEMKNKAKKIVYPEGWINGINPFNHTSDMESMTSQIMKSAKQIMENEKGISLEEAVSRAINKPVIDELKAIGLEDRLVIASNRTAKSLPATCEQIASQLAPDKINTEEIKKILKALPEEYRQPALELMSQDMRVYSPKKLTAKLQEIHKKICPDGNIKDIYYYVPSQNKSYGMITMQYQIANKIPSNHIITSVLDIPSSAKRVVILDDVAGSGQSLDVAHSSLRSFYKGDVTIAPVVSTETAQNLFNKLNDKKLSYLPGDVFKSFTKTSYYNSLPEEQKMLYTKLMHGEGYGGEGLNITFPYMAPDNNNYFFATVFAPKFTLNGNGVKNKLSWENVIPLPIKSSIQKEIDEIWKNANKKT